MSSNNNNDKPTKRVYGQWTPERELALVEAMLRHHPTYDCEQGNVAEAWRRVVADVNEVQAGEKNEVGERSVKEKMEKLKNYYMAKQFEDSRSSGSAPSDTPIERLTLEYISQVMKLLT